MKTFMWLFKPDLDYSYANQKKEVQKIHKVFQDVCNSFGKNITFTKKIKTKVWTHVNKVWLSFF